MKLRNKINLALPIALVMVLAVAGTVTAASTTIDLFSDGVVDIEASSGSTPNYSLTEATGILGTERDALVEYQSGSSNLNLRIDVADSDFLELQVGSGVQGRTLISWDGDDNNAATLDADGLGGVDLVDSTNDGLAITVLDWDGNDMDVTFTIYTDDTNYSEATLQLRVGPPITSDTIYTLSFTDDFVATGGSGATFTNVGAVTMEIQTIEAGADISLNVTISDASRDFGDLPDTYNNTLYAESGARHTLGSIYLGSTIDEELDGQESADATADGTDEDGIVVVGPWNNGAAGGTIAVTFSAPDTSTTACLSGWIDWNNNGSFADTGDFVLDREIIDSETTNYSLDVPANTFGNPGIVTLNTRWRIFPNSDQDIRCSDEAAVASTGMVKNGEVEDYQWEFNGPTAVTLISLTAEPRIPSIWVAMIGTSLLLVVSGGWALRRKKRN